MAPISGLYTFWIASSNQGALYLSNTSVAAHKTLIASSPGNTGEGDWYADPQQQSAGILLQQSQAYYIEAIYQSQAGFDMLQVAVQIPASPTCYGLPICARTTPPRSGGVG